MGEVVINCEDGLEIEEKIGNKENSSLMVKWEKFLPRVSLRVLLVEADDSTRQIISALLRKCSYKVASVCDGLKAWEVLKARPHNIDLILTEVELPSISGYALLTLIMEHDICKNIPVIMMSTHDSVSTVYKCMLRGAADFLVKPIRTNELKNLWQHVWRRQSMSRPGVIPQDDSVAQQKLEATAENSATSDRSSSSKSCSLRHDNCIKKGSDAQSSCGKLDLQAASGNMTEAENHSLPKQMKSPVSDLNIQEHSNDAKSDKNLCGLEIAVAESHTGYGYDNNALVQDGRLEQPSHGKNVNLYTEASNKRDDVTNCSSKAIDLIGALRGHPRLNSCVNDVANKFESSPELNLSLRRFNYGLLEHKTTYDNQMLNHSNASAFIRYVNKAICSSDANATTVSTPKGSRVNAGDNMYNSPGSNTNPKNSSLPHERKVICLPMNITKDENEHPTASQKLLHVRIPVGGIRVDVCTTPSTTNQQQNSYPQLSVDVANGRHQYHPFDQSLRISSDQPISQQDQNLESTGDRTQLFQATDQSASSTLCNETAGNLNVFGCAGNVHQDAMVSGCSRSGNEQNQINSHEMNRQRSMQREAALTKFRLKRKERCFEKKVRYESRKKLAEKRPRVKGQFVRQFPPDPPPKTNISGGTSMAN